MSVEQILNGKYRLDRLIGQGGFGEVYQATDLTLQRQVAIKLIKDDIAGKSDMLERFLNEARLTSQLKHPNTLTIYDFGKHDKQLFLVSELLEGEDLRTRLQKSIHLQPHEMIDLFVPICKALHEAHQAGVIHRDLKPDNLFLNRVFGEEKLVLLDFGIAKTLNQSHHTQTGHFIGTPYYMAPEQITQSKTINHTADIYSLGIIFYEVLSGTEPYSGESVFEILQQHIKADIPKIDQLVSSDLKPFEQLISRMLSKAPTARPQSALDIAYELEQIKTQVPATVDLSRYLSTQKLKAITDDTLGTHDLLPNGSFDETLQSMDEQARLSKQNQVILDQTIGAEQTAETSVESNTNFKTDVTLESTHIHSVSASVLSEQANLLMTEQAEQKPFTQSSVQSSAQNSTQSSIQSNTIRDDQKAVSSIAEEEYTTKLDIPPAKQHASYQSKLPMIGFILLVLTLVYVIWSQEQQKNELRAAVENIASNSKETHSKDMVTHSKAKDHTESAHLNEVQQKTKVPNQPKSQTGAKVASTNHNSTNHTSAKLKLSAKKKQVSAQKKTRKTKKQAQSSSISSKQAKGLNIKLSPKLASYAPKDRTIISARFKSGQTQARKLKVTLSPKTLGKVLRENNKSMLKQKFQQIAEITWGTANKKGTLKVCLKQECEIRSIIIIDKDIGKKLNFSTEGINFDELE